MTDAKKTTLSKLETIALMPLSPPPGVPMNTKAFKKGKGGLQGFARSQRKSTEKRIKRSIPRVVPSAD